jgi:hypothetical protein
MSIFHIFKKISVIDTVYMFIEYPIIILMFNSQTQHDGAERFQISHKLDKTDVFAQV